MPGFFDNLASGIFGKNAFTEQLDKLTLDPATWSKFNPGQAIFKDITPIFQGFNEAVQGLFRTPDEQAQIDAPIENLNALISPEFRTAVQASFDKIDPADWEKIGTDPAIVQSIINDAKDESGLYNAANIISQASQAGQTRHQGETFATQIEDFLKTPEVTNIQSIIDSLQITPEEKQGIIQRTTQNLGTQTQNSITALTQNSAARGFAGPNTDELRQIYQTGAEQQGRVPTDVDQMIRDYMSTQVAPLAERYAGFITGLQGQAAQVRAGLPVGAVDLTPLQTIKGDIAGLTTGRQDYFNQLPQQNINNLIQTLMALIGQGTQATLGFLPYAFSGGRGPGGGGGGGSKSSPFSFGANLNLAPGAAVSPSVGATAKARKK